MTIRGGAEPVAVIDARCIPDDYKLKHLLFAASANRLHIQIITPANFEWGVFWPKSLTGVPEEEDMADELERMRSFYPDAIVIEYGEESTKYKGALRALRSIVQAAVNSCRAEEEDVYKLMLYSSSKQVKNPSPVVVRVPEGFALREGVNSLGDGMTIIVGDHQESKEARDLRKQIAELEKVAKNANLPEAIRESAKGELEQLEGKLEVCQAPLADLDSGYIPEIKVEDHDIEVLLTPTDKPAKGELFFAKLPNKMGGGALLVHEKSKGWGWIHREGGWIAFFTNGTALVQLVNCRVKGSPQDFVLTPIGNGELIMLATNGRGENLPFSADSLSGLLGNAVKRCGGSSHQAANGRNDRSGNGGRPFADLSAKIADGGNGKGDGIASLEGAVPLPSKNGAVRPDDEASPDPTEKAVVEVIAGAVLPAAKTEEPPKGRRSRAKKEATTDTG